MRKTHGHNQRGFTLVELTMSMTASAVLMLVVMNLVSLSNNEWKQGNAIRALTTDLSISLELMSNEIKAAHKDTVGVSATNDSIKIGTGTFFYVDNNNTLIYERNGNTFEFLDEMVDNFNVEMPVVGASGDTLDLVSITLVASKESANDSTTIWLTPIQE